MRRLQRSVLWVHLVQLPRWFNRKSAVRFVRLWLLSAYSQRIRHLDRYRYVPLRKSSEHVRRRLHKLWLQLRRQWWNRKVWILWPYLHTLLRPGGLPRGQPMGSRLQEGHRQWVSRWIVPLQLCSAISKLRDNEGLRRRSLRQVPDTRLIATAGRKARWSASVRLLLHLRE